MDHVLLSYVAMLGKLVMFPQTHYVRLAPRKSENYLESWRRVVKSIDPSFTDDPLIVPNSVYKGQLAVLKELFNPDKKIVSASRIALIERWGKFLSEKAFDDN